jgi:hypothetical protein
VLLPGQRDGGGLEVTPPIGLHFVAAAEEGAPASSPFAIRIQGL